MPTNWTYTWRASGAKKENSFSRTLTAAAPPYDPKYRRITSITRRNGAFCNTGGANDTATILGVETLVDTSTTPETILLTSPQASCRVRGRNVSSDNYMTTSFVEIPVSTSHKIISAWKNGSLEIRRTLTLGKHSDRNCHAPYHRDGCYHDDITLVGTDSAYLPAFTASGFSASDADRLYAEAWQEPLFDFSLQTSIESSAYWENKASLCRRLTVSAVNLTDPDAPPMNPVSVLTSDTSSTSWSLTQADFDFSSARSNGFARGCRYRVDFTLAVGVDAENLTETTVLSAEIDVVAVPLHLSRHGNGVAIGRYSSVTDENDTLFECAYPAIFEQGIKDHANAVFSTEETDTGAKWIDGRKIYRCVFTGSTGESGKHVSIGNFPSTPETIIRFHGSFKSKSDGKTRPLPFASYASNDWNISPAIDGQSLELYIGASNKGGEYWLVFEYTRSAVEE